MKQSAIEIKISTQIARCLQRMIYEEIKNQKQWKEEDEDLGLESNFRNQIIKEMKELADDLEKQGVGKYQK